MHELSIAMGIADLAAEEAARLRSSRVIAVHLKLGPLSGVVSDALCSAFQMAREEEPALTTAELVIETIPVVAHCHTCGADRTVPFPELRCPVCDSPTPEVLRGRELEVFALEIDSP
jgi:hydrogenase nickel incorporation protein HypA/HybF